MVRRYRSQLSARCCGCSWYSRTPCMHTNGRPNVGWTLWGTPGVHAGSGSSFLVSGSTIVTDGGCASKDAQANRNKPGRPSLPTSNRTNKSVESRQRVTPRLASSSSPDTSSSRSRSSSTRSVRIARYPSTCGPRTRSTRTAPSDTPDSSSVFESTSGSALLPCTSARA